MGVQLPHGEGDKEEERKVAQDSAAQRRATPVELSHRFAFAGHG